MEAAAKPHVTPPPTRPKASVLCCDDRGPYATRPVNCYNATRDARTFPGPGPVIAHPPCGPWGRLRGQCSRQDPELGPFCVRQVQAYGGILEHPAWSTLWRHCGLPRPGQFPDRHGGYTVATTLAAFGAAVRKPTWLYVVGIDPLPPLPRPRPATRTVQSLHSRDRQLTPPAMADWLIDAVTNPGEAA